MLGGAGIPRGPVEKRPPATLVVVAAGSGERLGADRPKALVPVAGRPLYRWSLAAARAANRIGAVVIAAPPGHEGEFADPATSVQVVTGGAVRSESVLRALAAVESELVVVHDAARPLVAPALFDLAVERLEDEPALAGIVAAAPVTDTIKRCAPVTGDGRREGSLPIVTETLDRSELWAVQTPQAFRTEILRAALERPDDLAAATDDAMLVEAAGGTVAILPAGGGNFKVTTREDLERADSLLSQRVSATR